MEVPWEGTASLYPVDKWVIEAAVKAAEEYMTAMREISERKGSGILFGLEISEHAKKMKRMCSILAGNTCCLCDVDAHFVSRWWDRKVTGKEPYERAHREELLFLHEKEGAKKLEKDKRRPKMKK